MTSWLYDAVDLETYGTITMFDDYLDTASKRGGNQTIPNRHGVIYVPKLYDERTLGMGIAINADTAEDLEQALDDLKKLFSRGQKILSNVRADETIRTTLAAVEGQMQVKRESFKFARAVINFKLATPFFWGSTLTEDVVTVDAASVDLDVDNVGTVEHTDPTIVLTGPLDDIVITNPLNSTVFRYNAAVASPRVVTIQTVGYEFVATDDLGANMITHVEHEGSAFLLVLEPGINPLEVASSVHTTGTVGVKFYPPYL